MHVQCTQYKYISILRNKTLLIVIHDKINFIHDLHLYFYILSGSQETLVLNYKIMCFFIVLWDVFCGIKVLQTYSGSVLFTDLQHIILLLNVHIKKLT